ncbi:MAG TPA: hypothetical protein VGB53_16430 [Rubricoccaceae bacterium]|jgi:hypothetical protein
MSLATLRPSGPDSALPDTSAAPPEDVADAERHHVTRIDIAPSDRYPRRHPTHGWQVRARRGGTRESKFFADARHGSSDGALAAALDYRDRLLASRPAADAAPRKAWSNTGVIGLSVREKDDAGRTRLYVQLNWVDAGGTRRASSYSVDKWGLRRALWNGCLRLYRERTAAGAPAEEPHLMFARAQEPFADHLAAELARERAAAPADPAAAETSVPVVSVPESPARVAPGTAAPHLVRVEATGLPAGPERDEEALRRLQDVLFS